MFRNFGIRIASMVRNLLPKLSEATAKRPEELFTKNTGLCEFVR